jgi:hypothetical protein
MLGDLQSTFWFITWVAMPCEKQALNEFAFTILSLITTKVTCSAHDPCDKKIS